MKEILTTQNKVAIVDDDDFKNLMRFKWYAQKGKGYTFYAQRNGRKQDGKRFTILMHREILEPPKEKEIDHIDGDGLNNARANLRIVTHAENMKNYRMKSRLNRKLVGAYKLRDKWLAQLKHHNKDIYLGIYKTKKEATIVTKNFIKTMRLTK
jgi:hypothetical protein